MTKKEANSLYEEYKRGELTTETFAEKLLPFARKVARLYVGSKARYEVSDIASISTAKALSVLHPEIRDFYAWFWQVVKTDAIDAHDKETRHKRDQGVTVGLEKADREVFIDGEAIAMQRVLVRELYEQIELLPEKTRVAVQKWLKQQPLTNSERVLVVAGTRTLKRRMNENV